MTRAEAKINILHKIDEISPFDDVDIQWDSLIEGTLDASVRTFYCTVPSRFLKAKVQNLGNNITLTRIPIDKASFELQSDCIRLISIICTTWQIPITKLITPDMQEFRFQSNIYLKGGSAKPKGYVTQEMSTADATKTVQRVVVSPFTAFNDDSDLTYYYIPMPDCGDTDNDTFAVQEDLQEGIFWFVAYSILISMKQAEFSKQAYMKYQEFLATKEW